MSAHPACGLDDLPLGLMRRLADMHPDVPWSYRPIFSFLAGSHPEAVFSLVSARHDILAADSSSAAGSSARIDADELPGLNLPSREEVEACFEPDGLVNRMYPGYEPRMEQVQMAAEVRDALATSSHRVIEAGTGVGKSIAYLVPFAQAAKRNNITVGIATKSNNLADQLMYHELPRLAREIEGGLTYCASRAMTTTPACENLSAWRAPARSTPRATQQTRSPPSPLSTPTPANRPLAISMDWAFAGGVCERPISPPPHANALGGCAPFTPTNVWSHGSRRRAARADVVVTNHSLLFRNVAADGRSCRLFVIGWLTRPIRSKVRLAGSGRSRSPRTRADRF